MRRIVVCVLSAAIGVVAAPAVSSAQFQDLFPDDAKVLVAALEHFYGPKVFRVPVADQTIPVCTGASVGYPCVPVDDLEALKKKGGRFEELVDAFKARNAASLPLPTRDSPGIVRVSESRPLLPGKPHGYARSSRFSLPVFSRDGRMALVYAWIVGRSDQFLLLSRTPSGWQVEDSLVLRTLCW
jgi:hypothetical protein